MSKIELSPLPSGFATTAALNARLDQIEDEFNDKVLYRSNPEGEPNAMENILDMADHNIINLPDATEDHHAIPYGQFIDGVAQEVNDQLADQMLLVGTGNVIGPLSSTEDQVALFSGITGKLLKAGQTITQYLDSFLVTLYNIFPKVVDTFASISSTSLLAGQVIYLKQHTSSLVGGGYFVGVSSAGLVPDGGTISTTATAGVYAKRIGYDKLSIHMFGGLTTNTAAQNDTANSAAMASLVTSGGGTLYYPAGVFLISQTITSTASAVTIELDNECTIDYSAVGTAGIWDYCALAISGAGSRVVGGDNGGFLGPAAWDGTNVTPTYASIVVNADNCYVSTRLQNIRKVGVWFKDCSDGYAQGCLIEGNYPSGLWTGIETAHYGLLFDPTTSPSRGNFRVVGNTIKLCVQGILAGNYGVGQFLQGLVITGNVFESCWNHGIYSNYTSGATIVGNNFNRCQIMVVAGGPLNNVSGNTGYTDVDVVGDQRDVFGISMRDSTGCICSNNTLKGVNIPGYGVAISWQDFGLSESISDNVCSGNTVVSTAGDCVAIRMLSSSVPMNRNIICNNVVSTFGTPSEGAISVYGTVSNLSLSNKISGNIINLRGSGWGIYATYQKSLDVTDNTVVYAYNSVSPTTTNTVAFAACEYSKSDNNRSVLAPTFGTNVGVTGFVELISAANNSLSNSVSSVVAPATYNTYQVIANSNLMVNDSGIGAPSQTAALGSVWRRTDGGSATTLYIKETGNTSTVWRGI